MLSTTLFAVCVWASFAAAQSNAPPGVPVWCGKAYMSTNASFDPGGQLVAPAPSSKPLLDLTIRPRMSLYLAGETTGEFIVDAAVSHFVGQPIGVDNATPSSELRGHAPDMYLADSLAIDISVTATGRKLVSGVKISFNSTSNQVPFNLSMFEPSLVPYGITLLATSAGGFMAYTAKTNVSYLPLRTDGGSVARIDSLFHGMFVQPYHTQKSDSSVEFVPIFPYTFYMQTDFAIGHPGNVSAYAEKGYNVMHLVPNAASDPSLSFGTLAQFESFLDEVEANGLYVMYDMRWTYQNHSAVVETVKLFGARKCMLLWYTADEPDGQVNPLNATSLAYKTLTLLDPYHPVSLVLNCFNYHYAEYTSGADIILTDPYPIGNNLTHSTTWNTPCNATYGDCGCDNCTDVGGFSDISLRHDTFNTYDRLLGRAGTKVKWAVPQAFGNSEYWSRVPTPAEERVMNLLPINHGAKAIVMWLWPTTSELAATTADLSRVLAREPVLGFLTGAPTTMRVPWSVDGGALFVENGLDVAAWVRDAQMLVSVVNMNYRDFDAQTTVRVALPRKVAGVRSVLMGEATWVVGEDGISAVGMKGLDVALLVLDLSPS